MGGPRAVAWMAAGVALVVTYLGWTRDLPLSWVRVGAIVLLGLAALGAATRGPSRIAFVGLAIVAVLGFWGTTDGETGEANEMGAPLMQFLLGPLALTAAAVAVRLQRPRPPSPAVGGP